MALLRLFDLVFLDTDDNVMETFSRYSKYPDEHEIRAVIETEFTAEDRARIGAIKVEAYFIILEG